MTEVWTDGETILAVVSPTCVHTLCGPAAGRLDQVPPGFERIDTKVEPGQVWVSRAGWYVEMIIGPSGRAGSWDALKLHDEKHACREGQVHRTTEFCLRAFYSLVR